MAAQREAGSGCSAGRWEWLLSGEVGVSKLRVMQMRRRSAAGRDCLPKNAELPASLRTRRQQFRDLGFSALWSGVSGGAARKYDQRLHSVALFFWILLGNNQSIRFRSHLPQHIQGQPPE